jgi:hypothetical protein
MDISYRTLQLKREYLKNASNLLNFPLYQNDKMRFLVSDLQEDVKKIQSRRSIYEASNRLIDLLDTLHYLDITPFMLYPSWLTNKDKFNELYGPDTVTESINSCDNL